MPADALAAASLGHGPASFGLGVAFTDCLTLVLAAAAPRERDFDLGSAVFEVQLERYKGAAIVVDRPLHPLDLVTVHEQLAVAFGVVSERTRGAVLPDVQPIEPQLAIVDTGVAFADRDLGLSQRLDLAALEHDAAFEGFAQLEVVPGATIGRDRPRFGLLPLGHTQARYRAGASVADVIEITPDVRDAIFAHAIACLPLEACAMVSAASGSRFVDVFHPIDNAAASATRFELDPQQMLDLEQGTHASGRDLVGIVHSHVDTSPYPSPTDVEDSGRYDPRGTFRQLIVSLRHAEPAMRCYRIADGAITEELLVVVEPEPTVHDQAGAVAAVMALPRRPAPKD